jgi:AcrR family transcriptional regulator
MVTGLREQKKERTHDELVTAALDLFAAQGFDGTTVEDIADAVGVSPRTFFRYFPTKEDVLFAEGTCGGTSKTELVMEALRTRAADADPAVVLRDALRSLVHGYEDELPRLLLRKQVMASTPALRSRAVEKRDVWEANVIDELRTWKPGTQRERTLELKVTVATTIAALKAAIDTWLESDGKADLTALLDRAFAHLGTGLTPKDAPR